jgi:hypothetical protein
MRYITMAGTAGLEIDFTQHGMVAIAIEKERQRWKLQMLSCEIE